MMLVRGCLIVLLILIGSLEASARAKDPRVPPGTDPGGVALALVSTGVDYTLPQIARRLARDGEGQLIGRDFADDDALPYAPTAGDQPWSGTGLATSILAEAPFARLIPVRIDPQQPISVANALAFVARTPARIVLVATVDVSDVAQLLRQSVQAARNLLIIAPATGALAELDNVLTIESYDGGDDSKLRFDPDAGLRAMGIAAELAANDANLDGAGLKRAVLARLAR